MAIGGHAGTNDNRSQRVKMDGIDDLQNSRIFRPAIAIDTPLSLDRPVFYFKISVSYLIFTTWTRQSRFRGTWERGPETKRQYYY